MVARTSKFFVIVGTVSVLLILSIIISKVYFRGVYEGYYQSYRSEVKWFSLRCEKINCKNFDSEDPEWLAVRNDYLRMREFDSAQLGWSYAMSVRWLNVLAGFESNNAYRHPTYIDNDLLETLEKQRLILLEGAHKKLNSGKKYSGTVTRAVSTASQAASSVSESDSLESQ